MSHLVPNLMKKLVVKGVHYVFDGADVAISSETAMTTFMEQSR